MDSVGKACFWFFGNLGVSKNRGKTPKSSISIGFSIIFTIHFGVPLFLETPILYFYYPWQLGKMQVSRLQCIVHFRFFWSFLTRYIPICGVQKHTQDRKDSFVPVKPKFLFTWLHHFKSLGGWKKDPKTLVEDGNGVPTKLQTCGQSTTMKSIRAVK